MDEFGRLRELENRVDGVENLLSASRDTERNALAQVHALRADVARLTLLVEALRRVAVDGGLTTAGDFLERAKQVDAEDGLQDLQRFEENPETPHVGHGDGCRHFNPAHLEKRQYCGRPLVT